MSREVPVALLASIDPILRDTAGFAVLSDMPDAVTLSYLRDPAGRGTNRFVSDRSGVLERSSVGPDAHCIACAIRDDVAESVRRLVDLHRWEAIAVVLPVVVEPMPVVRALHPGQDDEWWISRVASLIDLTTAEHDLVEDDLLAERGLALTSEDRRSVGEALLRQIGYADTIVAIGVDPVGSALVDRLRGRGSTRLDGVHRVDARYLFTGRHDAEVARCRIDPYDVRPRQVSDGDVWTIELESYRPFHPDRLRERLVCLGIGRFVGRGHFWLPTRPESVCGWDGAGGQLSIGRCGQWRGRPRSTRLVYTGIGPGVDELRSAFDDALLRDEESGQEWAGRADGFEPWLGEQEDEIRSSC